MKWKRHWNTSSVSVCSPHSR